MSLDNFPPRKQIEAAAPLDMEQTRSEKPAQITISVSPAGLVVTAEYTGVLSSIPLAIERLRAAGVLDLVAQSAPAPSAQSTQSTQSDTPPMCPVHGKVMKAMAKPDKSGLRFWCTQRSGDDFCKERA